MKSFKKKYRIKFQGPKDPKPRVRLMRCDEDRRKFLEFLSTGKYTIYWIKTISVIVAILYIFYS